MTTSDYLTQLQQDKSDLVDNLTEKGITGLTGDETFTELVPEVLNIPAGASYAPQHITFYNDKRSLQSEFENELSAIDTSNLTNLDGMFVSCANITSLDLSVYNFDTSNVTNMDRAFNNCAQLTEINISNFSNENVTTMQYMFASPNISKIDMRGFEKTTGINTIWMFGTSSQQVPNNCLIIVKNETVKNWVLNIASRLTNVKTVAEYEASLNE